MFSIRVVTVDHYVGKPIEELYENEEKGISKDWLEPVLRIFGATADGIRTCVHVHGVYPYMYIPYKGGENPERDALLVGAALDEALKTTLNPKLLRYVYKVTPVSGIPLYGYHSKARQFFKIYFYNPSHIKKASELLLSGGILGQKLQPHEAHIPFALQFMMDYNIYGMSFATFSKVKYRRSSENPDSLMDISEKDFLSIKIKKTTCSLFEVDALACDIVNRIDQSSKGSNPGLRAIWEDLRGLRRKQERNSHIKIEESEPRANVVMYSTEIMYKAQLAQKLQLISLQEPDVTARSGEPKYTYPAVIPENVDFGEASAIEEGVERLEIKEHMSDISVLIDEKILTQIVENEEKEEEETEADSVLGRNQNGEEEAELEDEEGVDMTQPLDLDEEVICGTESDRDEPGGKFSEDRFWRNMAEKIFQLDGTQESSSESETEAASSGTFGGQMELSSAWSGNIMSILSEDSGCPTPSTVCQTPRTFWSNYSPNWSPQNQDALTWNKNCSFFSDIASKDESDALNSSDFSRDLKETISEESYDDLFVSNEGEPLQVPAMTSFCNIESAASPTAAILTHPSGPDGVDINLDSVCEGWPPNLFKEDKFSLDHKLPETKTFSRKPESDRQKFLHVLKSFAGRKESSGESCGQLTLKQYIKDCKEIVSVDFKNLCNKEMIIIEYKSENKRSYQNKYLIKPLDKFLENWDFAEKKANDHVLSNECDPRKIVSGLNVDEKNLRSVINVLEKRFSDSSSVQSVSNKLTLKSMELLPNEGNGKDRCYNVNQNVISQGKIKMKLIKSQGKNLDKNLTEEMFGGKCFRSDFKKMAFEKVIKTGKKQDGGSRFLKSQRVGKTEKPKKFSEPDAKLISEINSSFEEYFKNIVQRKHFNRRKKSSVNTAREEVKEDEWEGKVEKEEELQGEKGRNKTYDNEKPYKKRRSQNFRTSSNAESIRFVTRFLTKFSRMSDMPPLSITISLGNSQTSVPVQVNLQPPITSSGNEVQCFSKIQRRNVKLENVDGPADGSSSDDSSGGDSKQRDCNGKKVKGESYYKPLNVVVRGSPSKKKGPRKKRKISSCGSPFKEEKEEKEKECMREKMGRKSFRANYSEDGFNVFRENPKRWSFEGEKKEETSGQDLVKRSQRDAVRASAEVNVRSSKEVISFENHELDFIGDSDEERKRKPSGAWPKMNSKTMLKKIPQADTEAFSSSGDDEVAQDFFFKGEEVVSSREKAKRKELFDREILAHSEKLSFESEDENKSNRKKWEGRHPDPSKIERVCDKISPVEINRAHADYFSRGLKTPGLGTGLGLVDDSTDSVHPQQNYSHFTLSGSPLLSSMKFGSSAESEGKLVLTNVNPIPGSSAMAKVYSLSELSGHSKQCGEETDLEAIILNRIMGHKIIKPKKGGLAWKDIVKSADYEKILESEESAPFYSDPRDMPKVLEGDSKVLKRRKRFLTGLRLFKSSLDIVGIEERRNRLFRTRNIERWHLVKDIDKNIVPLKKPPPTKTMCKWSFTCHPLEASQKIQKKFKKTMVKPLSPGEEMESDDEMELSVTTCGFSGKSATSGLVNQGNFSNDHSRVLKTSKLTEVDLGWKKGPLSKVEGLKQTKLLNTAQELLNIAHHPSSLFSTSTSSGEGKRNSDNSFQIRGITLDNTLGFRNSVEDMQDVKLSETYQYMSMLVMELHVQTRKDLRPDPCHDPICALFYAIAFDNPSRSREAGILVVGDQLLSGAAVSGLSIHYVHSEKELIAKLLGLVRTWDPEILAGYEIEMNSWGYLVQRGFILDLNLLLLLGRVQVEDTNGKSNRDFIGLGDEKDEDIPRSVRFMRISGRIVLDIWRILRHEVALTSYSFENVMYHLTHERHPLMSHESLSRYWAQLGYRFRHIVVEHYTARVLGVMRILDQLDFINRTSELSRLFGIQFYEVLSRGSQFRVESMMLRLAKPLNYVPVSPSVSQRAAMRAPASLPLILEPESLFYSDPVIVLDFQSLYPSIIIAYNYCFSTCLGRIEELGGREPFEFGCTQLQISPEEIKQVESALSISPAGVAFVNSSVRKGVLPTMLEEILETRMLVKNSMKENKGNKTLEKVLYARQLGLKLIANVTYGYTAANFSGRMPCIEVGDSVVSKGRETLHRAIQLVKSTKKWGAKVVYGDTDSIFVCTPGKTREEAFKIGAEIAEAVTQDNPKPVKLKLEKVYQPSILQTKKRYVGYMFESPEQEKPVFEAKGIETVRRDGCPATRKILEKALQILFDTSDLSLVKKYTIRQFAKLFQGRVNLQDLIFAKEYRGRKGYRPGACVPALQMAKEWTQYDKRAEPRVKERVPYVIVNGPPGVPLIRLVRSPADLISDPSLRINAVYYITKAFIPPLQRCFSLLGADVMSWFFEMPRKYHKMFKWNHLEEQKRKTISQYFAATECLICSDVTNTPVCLKCGKHPQIVAVRLNEEIRRWERCHDRLLEICRSCCNRSAELDCVSFDCPVLFRRKQAARALSQGPALREILSLYA